MTSNASDGYGGLDQPGDDLYDGDNDRALRTFPESKPLDPTSYVPRYRRAFERRVRPFEVMLFEHNGVKPHCKHFSSEEAGWAFVRGLPATQDFEFRNLKTNEVLAQRPQE